MLQTVDVPTDVSNMKDRGLSHFQTSRTELKIRHVGESVLLMKFEALEM